MCKAAFWICVNETLRSNNFMLSLFYLKNGREKLFLIMIVRWQYGNIFKQ